MLCCLSAFSLPAARPLARPLSLSLSLSLLAMSRTTRALQFSLLYAAMCPLGVSPGVSTLAFLQIP